MYVTARQGGTVYSFQNYFISKMTDMCLEFQPKLISGQLHLTALEICTVFIVLLFNFVEVLLFFFHHNLLYKLFLFKCDKHLCVKFLSSPQCF